MNTTNMPGFAAVASLYKTSGRYRTRRQANNLPTRMISATYINTPGFTAESALPMAGLGYRQIANALSNDSRRSVYTALISQGDCTLDYTITVVENGVPSTTNVYKCGVVEIGGDGGPGGPGTPYEGDGPHGPGGGGVPFGDKPKPKRPRPPARPTPLDKSGCTDQQIQSAKAKPCHEQIDKDLMGGVKNRHYFHCDGSKMECCQNYEDYVTICDDL